QIAFTNKDPDRHNVSIPALDIDEDVSAGETFTHTFETGGEFAVSNKRSERPMRMTIVVE
ncbi:MAG: cupredoxin domain-containing protein, partial [Persicimonas sp.]